VLCSCEVGSLTLFTRHLTVFFWSFTIGAENKKG
jgi:hypothetical protein